MSGVGAWRLRPSSVVDQYQLHDIGFDQLLAGILKIYCDAVPIHGLHLPNSPSGATGVPYAVSGHEQRRWDWCLRYHSYSHFEWVAVKPMLSLTAELGTLFLSFKKLE